MFSYYTCVCAYFAKVGTKPPLLAYVDDVRLVIALRFGAVGVESKL